MRRIYLDHNATSPMPLSVRRTLADCLQRATGNPSSPHREGQAARQALEAARETIGRLTGRLPDEILFTSGGTEANNTALRGVLRGARRPAGRGASRLITCGVEHPSVLETARALEREGIRVDYLPARPDGRVDPSDLDSLLRQGPADLVSVMHANNETGVLQPVGDLMRLARARGVPFHTDAVQSAAWLAGGGDWSEADLVTLAAHKLGGPAGIGCLIVRGSVPFVPLLAGGAQEGRRRAGTESVPLAAAFAEAASVRSGQLARSAGRILCLRDHLEETILEIDPECRIHGRGSPRLPNTTNVYVPGAPGRLLAIQLDLMGFAVSTGSACSTGSSRPSHVLEAMGLPPNEAIDSLRISLGPESTREEISGFAESLRCARHILLESGQPACPKAALSSA